MLSLFSFLTNTTIRLGSLVLSIFMLSIFIGIGSGSVSLFILTKNDKQSRKTASNLITGFFLIAILTWKFLPILLNIGDIFTNPLMIIFATGGYVDVIIGTVLGTAYLIFKLTSTTRKRTESVEVQNATPLAPVLKPVLVFFITATIISSILFLTSSIIYSHSATVDEHGESISSIPAIGSIAPAFKLYGIDGNFISLDDYEGKWVILNFWATWCLPCLAEIPVLTKFYNEVDKNDIVIFGINVSITEKPDTDKDLKSYISAFTTDKKITFPVLLDISGKVSIDYDARSIPITVVISPEGVVTRVKTGVVSSSWLHSSVSVN